jgi:hypothetical protein
MAWQHQRNPKTISQGLTEQAVYSKRNKLMSVEDKKSVIFHIDRSEWYGKESNFETHT